MPRKARPRKVVVPPKFKGYKPFGNLITTKNKDAVELFYDEYEAIKLADYNLLKHSEAAKLMNISRPTFARIYETARRKIAKALVEAKTIHAVFGNAELEKNWYRCKDCDARFTLPVASEVQICGLCSSSNTFKIENQ